MGVSGATYEAVEENSKEFWSLQNINLLHEMQTEFPQPPPINILVFFGKCVLRFYKFVYNFCSLCRTRDCCPRIHPGKPDEGSDNGPPIPILKQRRRDITDLDRLIAYLEPHGTKISKDRGLVE